jgi:tetratricopeptide (TPR) repeat protein
VPPKSRGRELVVWVAILIVVGGTSVWWWRSPGTSGENLSKNSRTVMADEGKVFAGYAGSESCRGCHKAEFDLWETSHHGLAERPIKPEMDGVAFDPARTLKHASQTSEVHVLDGVDEITTLGFQSNRQPYRVERVIGENPVRQFLTPAIGGRWQVHELSYDPGANHWFDVYGDENRQPGKWGHWTGGGMNWNSRCADCHNTRVRKNYDQKTDSYHTKMAEMSVGCEACHGPLKAHVEWRKQYPASKAKDPASAHFSPTQVLETCGSCHSRQDNLTGDFQPGDSFFDDYSLNILDDAERWYPDGQVKDEDYEFTSFLSSKMHASGVSCQDCHDPHSMKTRLSGNNLCMRCHTGSFPKAPVINLAEHTHHQLGGKGDECIGCHMPVTVYMQRHARHDHGFTIPDPLLTKQFDIPNACNRCHTNQTADWSLKYVEQWYGSKMNRHTRERAQWIAGALRGDDTAKSSMIGMLTSTNESPYWRAVAAGLLWRWVNETNAKTALISSLQDKHPLVREKAARTLGEMEHADEIPDLKLALNDSARNVRVASAWALRATVDIQNPATKELQASLDFDSDQPVGEFHNAMFLLARNQPQTALEYLKRGVAQDPFSPPLRYELGEVLAEVGRTDEALAELNHVESLTPNDPQIPYARAKILMQAKRFPEAHKAINRALELQPGFKPAQDLQKSLTAK